ncbi:MAG: transposase [Actinomycetota bacterium]|nr:transposase [Actinomycetota bacterium]
MPQNFIPVHRDQRFLMPPDMKEWLPEDHLAFLVLDAVEKMDLSAFYARYRDDGWGRAAFEPRMMVALLLYAYAVGVRSSRAIERRCLEDVAFRIIAAGHQPDHATIARFRSSNQGALSELFNEALRLCLRAGLGRVGVLAIDGTKIKADASQARNRAPDEIEAIVEQMLDDAAAIDEQEDRLYGDKRGDELPEHLADPERRAEALRKAKEELEAERAQEIADYEAKLAEHEALKEQGKKPRGRPLKHPDERKKQRKRKVNLTDPESRTQKVPGGYVQGYNAQAAVSQDHIIVAADVTQDNNDVGQLEPLVTQARGNLEAVDAKEPIGTVVADAGYFSEDNTVLELGVELLIAPTKSDDLDEALAARARPDPDEDRRQRRYAAELAIAQRRAERREEVMTAYITGVVTASEAAQMLIASINSIYQLKWHKKKFGRLPDVLLPSPPTKPSARQVMLERFAQPGVREIYATRSTTVEPVFGQIKELRGVRRFMQRGLEACQTEWRLHAAAHNLRKLWSSGKWNDLLLGLTYSRSVDFFRAVPLSL